MSLSSHMQKAGFLKIILPGSKMRHGFPIYMISNTKFIVHTFFFRVFHLKIDYNLGFNTVFSILTINRFMPGYFSLK